MRNLNANAAAKIQESTRVQSIILVKIYWGSGGPTVYSDKEYSSLGFIGKLINIGSLDDVINIEASSSSASVAVTLDDTDGSLKRLIDTTDIHKTKIEIHQLFVDLNVNDAFPLFIGEVASPIVWNEGDRTLSFNAITRLDDLEAGFSVEEGAFPFIPASAVGAAWPLVFGTAGGVPALQIHETPSGILAEGIGAVNEPVWQKELDGFNDQLEKARQQAGIAYFEGWKAALRAADLGWPVVDLDGDGTDKLPPLPYTEETVNPDFDPEVFETDVFSPVNNNPRYFYTTKFYEDPTFNTAEPAEQAHEESVQHYEQYTAYSNEYYKISAEAGIRFKEKQEQEAYNKTTFRIITQNIPEGVPLQFKLGGLIYTGVLNEEYFSTSSRELPTTENGLTTYTDIGHTTPFGVSSVFFSKQSLASGGQKFYWIDAGTEIKLTNFPIVYIAGLLFLQINSIFAYKKGVRFRVPPSYYTISTAQFTNLQVTYITFVRPLSTIIESDGSTWDNDTIEYDAVSPIGPNIVDILEYLITTFTTFGFDSTSFAEVKTYLEDYPANFVLTTRKNIIALLKEIAYQARCALWIDDNIFFIRYLPKRPTAIDTITDDDVILNTFSIATNDSDRIITKYVATWKATYSQKESYKIIFKYNIIKYGTNEQIYDYYIYNNASIVEVVAQFWMIRQANNFKILKFKTAIHKLKLETLDPVEINMPDACNGTVIGIVQKATYNPTDYTIDFEVWIPVRFGEMTEYLFAHPKDLDTSYIYPLLTDPNIRTGNPFEGKGDELPNQLLWSIFTPYYAKIPRPSVNGRNEPVADILDNHTKRPGGNEVKKPVQEVLDNRDVDPVKPNTLPSANDKSRWDVKPQQKTKSIPPPPKTYAGKVVAKKNDNVYSVNVYTRGITKDPRLIDVTQFSIRNDETIPEGTPVVVYKTVISNKIDPQTISYIVEYFMQATVYADNQE